jgi:hypothetical protein
MLETHFAGIITEKRHNCDPSTPPAGAENLQMAWEDADQVNFAVLWYSHRQAWAKAA